jgi:hypothetical protein
VTRSKSFPVAFEPSTLPIVLYLAWNIASYRNRKSGVQQSAEVCLKRWSNRRETTVDTVYALRQS